MQIVLEYSTFWVALLQIVALDMPGAIVLPVALTTVAFSLRALHYLRLAGRRAGKAI